MSSLLLFLLIIITPIHCYSLIINNPSFENDHILNIGAFCPQNWSCSGVFGLSTMTGINMPYYDDYIPDGSNIYYLQNVGSGFSQIINQGNESGFVVIEFSYSISRVQMGLFDNPVPILAFDITGCDSEVNKRYLQTTDQWSNACLTIEICPNLMLLSILIVNSAYSYVVIDDFRITQYNTTADPNFNCFKMDKYLSHIVSTDNVNDFYGSNMGMTSWVETWVDYTYKCFYSVESLLGQLLFLQGNYSEVNIPLINSATPNYSMTMSYLSPCTSIMTDLTQCVGSISIYSVSSDNTCLIGQIPMNTAFGYQRYCNCTQPFFTISEYNINSFPNFCDDNIVTSVKVIYDIGPNLFCVLMIKSLNIIGL
jgi:hypothetical protein